MAKFHIFPGRHLAFTTHQEKLLLPHLSQKATLLFLITSSNQENCRYNPIPLEYRFIQVDRFAYTLGIPYRLISIPHYQDVEASSFIKNCLKKAEIATGETLSPNNTLVHVSTPPLIRAWKTLGFQVHEMEQELTKEERVYPLDMIREISEGKTSPYLHPASIGFFQDFPEVTQQIQTTWKDPLFSENGNLSDSRDYTTYASGMQANLTHKWDRIRPHILPGRIADEGCADGGLLTYVQKEHPESDLLGVDGSREFVARANERLRSGQFANTFTHFYCRNLLTKIFEDNSIDSTISNSTLHEIFSYNKNGEEALKKYLKLKYTQLKPNGVFLARDIVGPDNPNLPVQISCQGHIQKKGTPIQQTTVATRCHETLEHFGLPPTSSTKNGKTTFRNVPLHLAMEFLHRIDYLDNWESELKESFCFWNHQQWISLLQKIGFETKGSYPFTETWLYKHRFTPYRVQILDMEGSPLPPQTTHHILLARKPPK